MLPKRNFLLILFLLPVLLAAQNAYPLPKRVAVDNISPSMPNSSRNEENPQSLFQNYTANFHPIGWSNDGKAAYMIWSENEMESTFGVVVYDAVKDTIAGKWFENMGDNTYLEEEQIPAFWSRDKDSIVPLLERFHIVAQDSTIYKDFPATFGLRTYTMEYTMHTSPYDDHFYDGIAGDCVTILSGVNSSSANAPITWNGFYDVNIQPGGLWVSPGGQYALAVIVVETGGQHGALPPHLITYEVRTFHMLLK